MPFEGYPKYINEAAAKLGLTPHDAAVWAAQKQPAIASIASLVAQASSSQGGPHPDTIRVITQNVVGLEIAAAAARAMLEFLEIPKDNKTRPGPEQKTFLEQAG